jgi:hypothetical protein
VIAGKRLWPVIRFRAFLLSGRGDPYCGWVARYSPTGTGDVAE